MTPRQDDEQIPELITDREVADDAPDSGETPGETRDDHSEREWGGDQDIDTAGQVPDA